MHEAELKQSKGLPNRFASTTYPMHQTTLLEERLASILPWNRARLKFLSRLLVALLAVRTVNLSEVALALASSATAQSRYKQLQRFFRHFDLPLEALSRLLARLCGVPAPWVLSLDRTEWKLGQKHVINFLVLAIVGEGVAYPVCWMILDKPGASNTRERRKLLGRFADLFGANSIDFLCMDREFGGQAWLKWLLAQKIDFRLRIKCNSLLSNARGEPVPAKRLFAYLQVQQAVCLREPRRLWGLMLFVSVLKLGRAKEGDPYLIVVSALPVEDALRDYALRGNIETLFGALKSRAFAWRTPACIIRAGSKNSSGCWPCFSPGRISSANGWLPSSPCVESPNALIAWLEASSAQAWTSCASWSSTLAMLHATRT
jgi:hypothetical protein